MSKMEQNIGGIMLTQKLTYSRKKPTPVPFYTPQIPHELVWDFLENRTQLFMKFPAFYGTQGSVLCSQEPATGPYPRPGQSGPCPPIPPCQEHFNISPPLQPALPNGLIPSGFHTKLLYEFISPSIDATHIIHSFSLI